MPFSIWEDISRGPSVGYQLPSKPPTPVVPLAAPPPPAPAAQLLPAPSLAGQTWGWPIPITAGKRTVPGRYLWRRVTPDPAHVGFYKLDCAVSFGFRAEMLAGLGLDSFNFHRLLANGVVIKDWTTNGVAPGVTVTAYDGTQETADPFLVSIDGADDVQAFIFHIYCVVQDLPLKQFTNVVPDAWAIEIFDVVDQVEFNLFANSVPIVGDETAADESVSNIVVDFPNAQMWQASVNASGIVLKEWSITAHDSVANHPVAPWGGFPPAPNMSGTRYLHLLPASRHLLVFTRPASPSARGDYYAVNPGTNAITDHFGPLFYEPYFSLATNSVAPPGGTAKDVVIGVDSTALDTFKIVDYDGAAFTERASVTLTTPLTTMPNVTRGRSNGASCEFWFTSLEADGFTFSLYRATATYSGPSSATLAVDRFFVLSDLAFDVNQVMALPDGGLIVQGGDFTTEFQSFFARLSPTATVVWSETIAGNFQLPFTQASVTGGDTSLIGSQFIVGGMINATILGTPDRLLYAALKINVADGSWVLFNPFPDSYQFWGTLLFDRWQFDAPHNRIIGSTWGSGSGDMYELILGGTAGTTDELSLSRAYQLLGGLTRGVATAIDVDPAITDTVGSLFIVEQTSLTQAANQIGRACNCDVRENNQGLEVVRNVDGETYTIALELTEADLLRDANGSALTVSRSGDDQAPAEMRLQFIANEATFKYTEQRARRDFGPSQTTSTTAVASIRIPLGMGVNKAQTYVSEALYRETELRTQGVYKLAWKDAVKVQPGDVHQISFASGEVLLFKVTRADLNPDRTLNVTALRLHTAQDYIGLAFAGEGLGSFSATGD